jgi:trk system potassium uptake protein TrkA
MRMVFVGAGEMSLKTANLLIERGHEVVIIESDPDIIADLSEIMDCSFLQGDATKPDIINETGPEHSDALFCLTDYDQSNIIASLVGRSLGFKKVITRIEDESYDPVCSELGLENVVVPSSTIGRYLADMTEGRGVFELSSAIKHEARLFSFVVDEDDESAISEIDLPAHSKIICYYRSDEFFLADDNDKLMQGDQVIVLTHSKNLPELRQRWNRSDSQGRNNGTNG